MQHYRVIARFDHPSAVVDRDRYPSPSTPLWGVEASAGGHRAKVSDLPTPGKPVHVEKAAPIRPFFSGWAFTFNIATPIKSLVVCSATLLVFAAFCSEFCACGCASERKRPKNEKMKRHKYEHIRKICISTENGSNPVARSIFYQPLRRTTPRNRQGSPTPG